MRALTLVEIIFVGILLTGLLPGITPGSVICFVILMAAGVVVFRGTRLLIGSDTYTRPATAQSFDTASGGFPTYARSEWQRDGIEIRPNDSVDQIARSMVATSFRQASLKYHPDHGGSNDLMGRILQARILLLGALNRR